MNSMEGFLGNFGWTLQEEMQLLLGLSNKGFGNWKETAEGMGTKTAEECKNHYLQVNEY